MLFQVALFRTVQAINVPVNFAFGKSKVVIAVSVRFASHMVVLVRFASLKFAFHSDAELKQYVVNLRR